MRQAIAWYAGDRETHRCNVATYKSMGWCKKDVTPLLTHWSYVFLALTHGIVKTTKKIILYRSKQKSSYKLYLSWCQLIGTMPPDNHMMSDSNLPATRAPRFFHNLTPNSVPGFRSKLQSGDIPAFVYSAWQRKSFLLNPNLFCWLTFLNMKRNNKLFSWVGLGLGLPALVLYSDLIWIWIWIWFKRDMLLRYIFCRESV